MSEQYSPLPWILETDDGFVNIWDSVGASVAIDDEMDAETAAFIVSACNSHAELLAALKGLVERALEECDTTGCCGCTDRSQEIVVARAAIAKAEGR